MHVHENQPKRRDEAIEAWSPRGKKPTEASPSGRREAIKVWSDRGDLLSAAATLPSRENGNG
jgi:hypothetical protein